MSTVTINGHTYTDDGNANTGLANGGHRTRLIPLVADMVVHAAGVAANTAIATTKAGEAAASAASALASQNSSTANAGTATAQNTAAGISAGQSASSATQSAAARDLAISAWNASMAPAETLPAILKSLHIGAIVKAIIYDTSKDSDGGAWRKRCQDKSWYTEALGFTGAWRNQLANTAAAWAVPGAAAGDGFQNTTDGKYYVLTGTSTASEIFRGNVREFPAQVAIVAEAARVVIYDLTQVGTPMWMVLCGGGLSSLFNRQGGNATETAVSALNGQVLCAYSAAAPTTGGGLFLADFVVDAARLRSSQYGGMRGYLPQPIVSRLVATASVEDTTSPALVSAACKDIAITVLDNAPIDVATGLPVPTIAVATDGGVSVIRHDGTVATLTGDASVSSFVMFKSTRMLFVLDNSQNQLLVEGPIPTVSVAALSGGNNSTSATGYTSVGANSTSWGATMSVQIPVGGYYQRFAVDTAYGYALSAKGGSGDIPMVMPFIFNGMAPAKSMYAPITAAYNSGWQIGDSRGAWLADTVAGAVGATDPDRSVKNNPLTLHGSLTKSAVATGANLMAYSGFSAANYLEQPYSANLDFGTGDFCISGWFKTDGAAGCGLLSRRDPAVAGPSLSLNFGTGPQLWMGAGGGSFVCEAPGFADNNWHQYFVIRSGATCSIYIDGRVVASAASTADVTNTSAVLTIGSYYGGGSPFIGSQALVRFSATAPSADQIRHSYETEKALFQPTAKCCIDGTRTAVTALAYDESTDLLQVGTSWGRTSFKDLVRVDSEATTTGALTSLSANQGAILTGGTSAKYYQPAMLLRDELRRKEEARRALGKTPVFIEFDAVTSQVAFVVTKGYTVKAVYSAGTLKRGGSTKDYLVSTDGFQETVVFAVAPGNGVWVSIMGVRA